MTMLLQCQHLLRQHQAMRFEGGAEAEDEAEAEAAEAAATAVTANPQKWLKCQQIMFYRILPRDFN